MLQRRTVLTGLLAVTALLAGAILFDVLETVFLAVTVAYLLAGVHRRLVARGLGHWSASLLVTALGTGGLLVPVAGVGYLVYSRRGDIVAALEALPELIEVGVAGFTYAVELETVRSAAIDWLSSAAVAALQALPVLSLKLTLFGILVFALLVRRHETAQALLVPVPSTYYDVVRALHERTRSTLYALYVLQAVTGFATFVVAFPVFFFLGYSVPVTLAVAAGVLQFLPIVGPSVLVLVIAAYQVAVGQVTAGLVLLAVGLVAIGWLPDAVIRPRLARQTAGLPGSLYFIGFVGGLLTIGLVGIIAGPLVLALVSEVLGLLAPDGGRQAVLTDQFPYGRHDEGSPPGGADEDDQPDED